MASLLSQTDINVSSDINEVQSFHTERRSSYTKTIRTVKSLDGSMQWPLTTPFNYSASETCSLVEMGYSESKMSELKNAYARKFAKLVDDDDPYFVLYCRDVVSTFDVKDLGMEGRLPVMLSGNSTAEDVGDPFDQEICVLTQEFSVESAFSGVHAPAYNSPYVYRNIPIKAPGEANISLPLPAPPHVTFIVAHSVAQEKALSDLLNGRCAHTSILALKLKSRFNLDLGQQILKIPDIFFGWFCYLTVDVKENMEIGKTARAPGLHIDGMEGEEFEGNYATNVSSLSLSLSHSLCL